MNQPGHLKIAIIHLGFFYSGGGEKLVLEEIRGLRASGHEVTCFAPYVDKINCYPDYPEIREIQTFLPPPPSWLPVRDALWLTLTCIFIPLCAMRFRSYDVIFAANQPAPWFAFVLSKILRKPYIIYLAQPLRLLHPRKVDLENGIRIREGDHRFLMFIKKMAGFIIDWADRVSVREADIMLTNGEYTSNWLADIYGRKNISCPAGSHPLNGEALYYRERWSGLLKVNGNEIEKPYVLLTNRHSPQKRFEYALWALKRIAKSTPALSLIVTGQETSYTDQLRYLVDELRLKGKVHFVGLVSEVDLVRLYKEAALYVYPSPEEDFGMGIVEAMAAGTPVVAWNNGGPACIVKDGQTGFLIEAYDTEDFASKIQFLATNPDVAERMGRSAHKLAKDRFSYERHNQILEAALISAALSRREDIQIHKVGVSQLQSNYELGELDWLGMEEISHAEQSDNLLEGHLQSANYGFGEYE